jgi:ligand-binding sensor domain-containing protein/signal transduction histidine kinase
MVKFFIYLLSFFFLSALSIHSQNPDTKFERFAAGPVFSILQDRYGLMWFGTQGGLVRFDGYEKTTFSQIPFDSTSLSNIWVWCICEDPSGDIWVGTFGGGLDRFNRVTETFTHFRHDPNDSASISSDYIHSLLVDKAGNVWIGTRGAGLNKLDGESGKFIHYIHNPDDPTSLSHNTVLAMCEDSEGNLWIGTKGGGLNRLDRETGNFRHYKHDPLNPQSLSYNTVSSIIEDSEGNLWIGTGIWMDTTGGGLNKFDKEAEEFINFEHDTNNPNSLTEDRICSLVEDKSGNLWIGTAVGGLNQFDKKKEKFIHYQHDPHNSRSISSNIILSLYKDNAERLWIGTRGGGFNKLEMNQGKFSYYQHQPDNINSLSNNFVTSVYEDKDGVLWAGTNAGGLNKLDRRNNKITHYKHDPSDPNSISANAITHIREDQYGMLWVATRSAGLNKFDRKRETFSRYKHVPHDANSISINNIFRIYEDRTGTLWIGTWGGGLNKYDRVNDKFIRYQHDPSNPFSISDNGIRAIYEDCAGSLWIGTDNGGVNKFNQEDETFIHYKHDPNNPTSISSNKVRTIHEMKYKSPGIFWIATNAGLNRFIEKTGIFTLFTLEDGLPHNSILGILEDKVGNLWLTTAWGLSKFNPQTGKFKNYFTRDGLPIAAFFGGSYYQSESGEFHLGGHGLMSFYPMDIQDNSFIPPIVLTDFKIFNEKVVLDSVIGLKSKVELSYQQNVFSFEFSALNYTNPSKNEYAYMLEGFQLEWIQLRNKRDVTFTNLDPGEYTLRVKGSNNSGIWNEAGASIRITIHPPFWQTWRFRVIVLVFFVGLIYSVYKYRLNRLLQLERLRIHIASDLHDDIGASLSKIAVHSEIIQTTNEKKKITLSSKKIGAMSREIVTTLSDIVWSIDARNDTVGDLVDRMRDYVDSLYSGKEISLSFQTEGLDFSKKITPDIRQNVYLIFKEALNNSLKHSNATDINLFLKNGKENFVLTVSDNGGGITDHGKRSGQGIKNMEMRAKRIKGKLDINNDQGTEIVLTAKPL